MLTIFLGPFANATIITSGTLTHDTNTNIVSDSLGLDWHVLDYNNTIVGDGTISHLLKNRLAVGGDLYGWEIATQANYYTMLKNAGGIGISADLMNEKTVSSSVNVSFTNIIDFYNMFRLGNSFGTKRIDGDFFLVNQSNSDIFNESNLHYNKATINQNQIVKYTSAPNFYSFNSSNSFRMSIMLSRVHQADIPKPPAFANVANVTVTVPEPTTLAIFALGMFGLASRRLKANV